MKKSMIMAVFTFGLFFVGANQTIGQRRPVSKRKTAAISKQTAPRLATTTLAPRVKMNFSFIPAGEFEMGSNNGEEGETPVHSVIISKGYWMQTTEVTQAQWKAVMGIDVVECDAGSGADSFKGNNMPIYCVSWDDAIKFMAKMNAKKDGHTYRLPTEAEWEYAARAGTKGDDSKDLGLTAWYWANSGDKPLTGDYDFEKLKAVDGRPHPVGTKRANAWGLYDMLGNVSEWCQDNSGDYLSGTVTDPTGPEQAQFRTIRGGGWGNRATYVRPSSRNSSRSNYRRSHIGFRGVRQ